MYVIITFAAMRIASNKIKDIARFFREELAGIYEPEELETIIRYCFEEFLNVPYFNLRGHENDTVSESELLKFNFAVKDLKAEKPLQYIFGRADFYRLKFIVNENVLIPRPETEELVDLIIKDLQASGQTAVSILDIGTGSGCIPVALKKNLPAAQLSAMDISAKALETAQQNAKLNAAEIRFIRQDILHPAMGETPLYDLIVSNPPYIKAAEKEQMQKNVLAYEPHLALFVDDDDPLLFYRAIADYALKMLKPGGRIYFEINGALGPETQQLLESRGLKNTELIKDLSNKNRILRGTR